VLLNKGEKELKKDDGPAWKVQQAVLTPTRSSDILKAAKQRKRNIS